MLDINTEIRYNISMENKRGNPMKKLIASLVLFGMATTASAHGTNWFTPMFWGGVAGYYIANRQAPQVVVTAMPSVAGVYIPTPPVVIGSTPQVVPVVPAVPYGYHYQYIFDAYCNCYRTALVPN